jgi:hypothetical protein
MAMISPPVAMLDFSGIGAISSLKLIITGEKDDIAPPSTIKKQLATWNPDTACTWQHRSFLRIEPTRAEIDFTRRIG